MKQLVVMRATSDWPAARRSLLGWEQKQLAEKAGLHPGTVNPMERCGNKSVAGAIRNLEKVQDALEKAGVEITEDGVRLIKKPSRR
jgi:transcriptional regulator with XRE-family HTH domain